MGIDFYAYSNDIFQDKLNFVKPNTSTYFARINENGFVFKHKIYIGQYGNRLNSNITNNNKKNDILVVVLGDSYTAGFDSETSWVSILEDKLNNKSKYNIKLVNLALPGTGPKNWISQKNLIKKLKPDFILVGLVDNMLLRPTIKIWIEDNIILSSYEGKEKSPKGMLINNLDTINNNQLNSIYNKYNKNLSKDKVTSLNSKYLNDNKENLIQLLKLSKSCMIIQMPTLNSWNKNTTQHTKSILNMKNDKIDFIELKLYMDDTLKELLYIKSGDHFNQKGNKYMAQMTYDFLNKNKNWNNIIK